MKFGGHETFPVREGWLFKGMRLIESDAEAFNRPHVADEIGVGRNMAKAIRHWLLVTQLAEPTPSEDDRKRKQLHLSEVGRLIWDRDPYCLQYGTWAALHVNLLNQGTHDYCRAWHWFFNLFPENRFDRLTCTAGLERFVERHENRRPATKTLQRDVACLLNMYSTPVPADNADPEDASDSPFRRLGLLTLFRDSNAYRRNGASVEALPPEVLGYALKACGCDSGAIPLREACFYDGGPGRAFQLGIDSFLDFVENAEKGPAGSGLRLVGSAGERFIQLGYLRAPNWLEAYYDRIRAYPRAA